MFLQIGDECTLRAAIEEANETPGADTIVFDIPTTGVATISPTSALPEITNPVTIDGYSQPGVKPNTLVTGNDAVLKIELSGTSATGVNGLLIFATNSTVKGLVINRWKFHGVQIGAPGVTGNKVVGNYVGTDASGTQDLGNSIDGVNVTTGSNNTVGGTEAGAGNTISGNSFEGVFVVDANATGNRILSNSINDNVGLGIDLDADLVTPNDPGDADAGPNNLQNFPVLTNARKSGKKKTAIEGTLNSAANTTFTLQFFSSLVADPSGNGEGQRLLGTKSVTTDAGGNASFTSKIKKVPKGQVVSATATDPGGNTSEFSNTVARSQT